MLDLPAPLLGALTCFFAILTLGCFVLACRYLK